MPGLLIVVGIRGVNGILTRDLVASSGIPFYTAKIVLAARVRRNYNGMGRRSRGNASRTNRHGGRLTHVEVGDGRDLAEIVARSKCPFLLILDGVQDPHNLGACLRTADAAGVEAVVVPSNRAVSLTETVLNIACGAAEDGHFIHVTSLVRTLEELQDAGVVLVGTSDDATGSLYEADLTGPLAFVLGAEGKGMRRLTKEACDTLVSIPMAGVVDCLNVSVATGVCLFEAARQRNARGGG